MAGALDSKVVFAARAKELGLSDASLESLSDRGWDTYGGLAFATAFAPTSNDYQHKLPATALRRLWYESQVLAAQEMKRMSTSGDEVKARKLNPLERQNRLNKLRKKLVGQLITDEVEPWHALVDSYVGMFEHNVLSYVQWDSLTSQSQEMRCERADQAADLVWRADGQGIACVRVHAKCT
eukprot:6481763-Amphidinium_carterae.5